MQRLPDNQCRRCGRVHEESWQLIDAEGRWALFTVQCDCGHTWTTIHTAPANLGLLRGWLTRGCKPPEGPSAAAKGSPWHQYRLEGISPALISAAS